MRHYWLFPMALAAAILSARAGSDPDMNAYTGMCDASAAVALDSTHFAVANDEDNVIRIYRAHQSGPAVVSIPLSGFLQVDSKKPETDFEGATWLGDRIYWISSHGRNKDGKVRESRHRFFAMKWQTNSSPPLLLPVGRPYRFLLQDLVSDSRLAPFGLAAASQRAPKQRNALNIEGLCSTPDGHLLIGFRNPIPNGKALLVPLLNAEEIIQGVSARFGEPILLDLDRLGIRDIVRVKDQYLIIGGAYDATESSHLYRWAGPGSVPVRIERLNLYGLNPEAIVVYPSHHEVIHLLSDDGTCRIGNVPCKMLKNPAQRQFRSIWLRTTDW